MEGKRSSQGDKEEYEEGIYTDYRPPRRIMTQHSDCVFWKCSIHVSEDHFYETKQSYEDRELPESSFTKHLATLRNDVPISRFYFLLSLHSSDAENANQQT